MRVVLPKLRFFELDRLEFVAAVCSNVASAVFYPIDIASMAWDIAGDRSGEANLPIGQVIGVDQHAPGVAEPANLDLQTYCHEISVH
jgi:hypothetical protein